MSTERAWDEPRGLLVQPTTLTILGTYRCTAACENCCFGSNPHIKKRIGLSDIISFIDEGSRSSNCKLVVFSGGECFLLGDDLIAAVAHATGLGLSTRCVTNGYWAKNMERGRVRLRALRDAGLGELNVSTGDFHQKFVSQETVVNAAVLSVELGMKHTVMMVEVQKNRRVSADRLASDPRIGDLLANPDSDFHMLESPWMPTDYEDRIEQNPTHMLNRRNVHLRGGCGSVLTTLVLTPDRNVGFCCGLPREQIPELNAQWLEGSLGELVEEASAEFMKIWLFVDGPERILAWAAGKDEGIEWENRYAHHCHACLALFKDPKVRQVIRSHHHERIEDVLMRYVAKLRIDQATTHDFAAPA